MREAKRLGENMKRIHARKSISQDNICRAMGADWAYISNVESGNKNPTLETLIKIAGALGVPVDKLLK